MNITMDLSWEEFKAARKCLERRYRELRHKVLEGDRKGRSIHWYREEAILLERVLEELNQSRF
ncbi:hypothetical protein [Paludifilum halophilum]|uniref:Uncharacterized protein n=1 Tax=Paludifilum halophilum TaxID=1642702 RepID=A0A235B584_9BACL|nr:hypothetical protein [Paludifilum halophilum]OYD07443.1 hypothetical protein CHM34_11100 [Paludifilum halophilum]